MSWKPNPGFCPPSASGKRVKVKLRNGMICGATSIAGGAPAGWPADENAPSAKRPVMSWRLTDHPADVVEWDFV